MAPLIHNDMGRITGFDQHKVGEDLEIASWDNYPLSFLEDRVNASEVHKLAFSQHEATYLRHFITIGDRLAK